MKRISEEVKKIREYLEYCYDEGKFSADPSYCWSKEIIIGYALDKICQLFPKTEDNPDGYEVKSEIGIACPFCGEDDFDLPGLKWHLTGLSLLGSNNCESFQNVEDISP